MLGDYMIPFHGLKADLHIYDFEVDDTFFNYFDNPDLPGGDIKIVLNLIRKQKILLLLLIQHRIKGSGLFPLEIK